VARASSAAAPAREFQDFVEIDLGHFERRHDPEKQPSDDGEPHRECQHSAIHRDARNGQQIRRERMIDEADGPNRAQNSRRTANARQNHAFGEQLPNQLRTARSNRGAYSQFFLSRRGAREKQIGDIRARDQQHKSDCAEQHQQARFQIGADERFEHREDVNAPIAHFRKLLIYTRGNRVHFCLRLLRSDARFHAAEHGKHVIQPVLAARVDGQGRIDFTAAQKANRVGQHADHRHRSGVERDDLAYDRGIRAETPLPHTLTENDHRSRAGFLFRVRKCAPGDRRYAEHASERWADGIAAELFGFAGAAAESEIGVTERRNFLERLLRFAPGKEVEHRGAIIRDAKPVIFLGDLQDAARLRKG
jgi:hypothetical protein